MSTATLSTGTYTGEDEVLQYRAIHIGAVLGIALAALLLAFTLVAATNSPEASIGVSFLNLAPLVCCVWALSRIRREPERFSGQGMARIGLSLSLVLLIGGVSYGWYVARTEVPDGYTKISFGEMKPDEIQERGGVLIPPEVAALNGKKVFIKGYLRPGSSPMRTRIDNFLLVRDNNTCCFGDLSKVRYFDQMQVQITSGNRVDDNLGILRMGGVLKIHPENLGSPSGLTVFSLTADYAK